MTSAPHCVNHPGAAGIALCVGCRSVLCAACTTRIQGRNLCAACISDELAVAPAPRARVWGLAVHLAVAFGVVMATAAAAALGLALHALG